MSFLEDAVSTAKTVGKTVGKRTEEIVIISKKKLAAIELENKLESLFVRLGEIYYEKLAGIEGESSNTEELIEDINRVKKELEELHNEIENINNGKR